MYSQIVKAFKKLFFEECHTTACVESGVWVIAINAQILEKGGVKRILLKWQVQQIFTVYFSLLGNLNKKKTSSGRKIKYFQWYRKFWLVFYDSFVARKNCVRGEMYIPLSNAMTSIQGKYPAPPNFKLITFMIKRLDIQLRISTKFLLGTTPSWLILNCKNHRRRYCMEGDGCYLPS